MPSSFLILKKIDTLALVTLHRPKVLNALSQALMSELAQVLSELEKDPEIHVTILKGSDHFFAAGVDVKEMLLWENQETFFSEEWTCITRFRKPIIAAVSGYALGGGCELAMMCDMIIASDNAVFGQPEITLGIMPGLGGTQRLARLVGKAKAMDMCLTGRRLDAFEAEKVGLVSRVVPLAQLQEAVCTVAKEIASLPLPTIVKIKQAILQAQEKSLAEGLQCERQLFYSCFNTTDQKEGMQAFLEKRKPLFKRGIA